MVLRVPMFMVIRFGLYLDREIMFWLNYSGTLTRMQKRFYRTITDQLMVKMLQYMWNNFLMSWILHGINI